MATPQKDKESSEKATKKAEEKPKKQTKPRKPYQMTTVVVAKETALLPEPLRASVVAMAHAIIRFFQHAWQEITGVGAVDTAPKLLPPGDRNVSEDE